MLKLSENPPVLHPSMTSVADATGPWWVAHTKARAEKVFAWDLTDRGVGYFLPLAARTTFSGGRKRHLMLPLFPSYVFFCGDETARYRALSTGRLCHVLPVIDQRRMVSELTQLERAIRCGAGLRPLTGPAVGERCRVIAGPFAGVEGVVAGPVRVRATRGPALLALQVSLLGQGAVLEIEWELLEVVREPQGRGVAALDRGRMSFD